MLDPTMRAIWAALDGIAARQRIIAQNVANADTPGYIAGRVTFEDSLREAIASGAPESMQIGSTKSASPVGLNGNNVNLDDENLSLIETGLRYQLAVESMNAKFRILRDSIRRDA